MARRGDAGADRRLPGRAAAEGRDRRRDRRLRRGDARARRCRSTRSATISSTRRAPAATAPTRSTSRPRPRSSRRRPAPAWRSTATAPSRRRPGAADVLEALGFQLDLPPERIEQLDRRARLRVPVRADAPSGDAARGAGAERARRADGLQRARPAHEPGRRAGAARRRLLAGARAARSPRCWRSSARSRAFVVHGAGGIDELSPAGPNLVCEVVDGSVREREIDPLDLGIPRCDPEELRGGAPARERRGDPRRFAGETGGTRSAVLLNAAGAIAAAGHAADLARVSGSPARRSTRERRPSGSTQLVAFSQAVRRHEVPRRARRPGLGAIAEFKRRSPSAGDIRPGRRSVAARRAGYERAGAARDLGARRRALRRLARTTSAPHGRRTSLPLLAKGFFSTRSSSASCAKPAPTRRCCCCATSTTRTSRGLMAAPRSSGSTRSSRPTTPRSSQRAIALDAPVIGVNARDLSTFTIDRARSSSSSRPRRATGSSSPRARSPRAPRAPPPSWPARTPCWSARR